MRETEIEFYTAKLGANAPDSLPNTEGAFRALPSGTTEQKVAFYEERERTHTFKINKRFNDVILGSHC